MSPSREKQFFEHLAVGQAQPCKHIGHESLMLFCELTSISYAGYGIVTEPTFSVSRVAFILAYGGVYAIAGIR